MPIVAADIVAYAALNKPTDDTSLNGGGIDVDERVTFTDIAANDDVEALSDNAADTMNLTITARKADGTLVSETKALTGTTAVIFSVIGVVERVERALLASDAACSTMTATSEARDHHPRRGERHPVRGKARHGVTVRYMFIRGRPVPTAQPS